MKNKHRIDLRPLLAEQQRLPDYLATSNQLTESRADEIARKFGDCLEDNPKDFDYANECGQKLTPGKGYPNAEKLFFGYLYDSWYTAACEDREAARNERDYQ